MSAINCAFFVAHCKMIGSKAFSLLVKQMPYAVLMVVLLLFTVIKVDASVVSDSVVNDGSLPTEIKVVENDYFKVNLKDGWYVSSPGRQVDSVYLISFSNRALDSVFTMLINTDPSYNAKLQTEASRINLLNKADKLTEIGELDGTYYYTYVVQNINCMFFSKSSKKATIDILVMGRCGMASDFLDLFEAKQGIQIPSIARRDIGVAN